MAMTIEVEVKIGPHDYKTITLREGSILALAELEAQREFYCALPRPIAQGLKVIHEA